MNPPSIFAQLESTLTSNGPLATLTELADHLRREGKYHELFETRKMQVRAQLGIPLLATGSETASDESLRERLESGLIEACREVGLLLLRSGRLREGWHYLRAVGDRELVRQELTGLQPQDQNLDEFLELWLHEGLDLDRGFRTLLERYGVCNAITTFDSVMYGRPRAERAIGAQLLVEHLHAELLSNIRGHLERVAGTPPAEASLLDYLEQAPWLCEQGSYHLDTTHLASIVRFARDVDQPTGWQRALELAEYGSRLDPTLQYAGEEPFDELYPTSIRYFHALLGIDVPTQLEFFRQRAEAAKPREETTLTIEVYVDLLARIGQAQQALSEALRLLPPGIQQTGRAPSLLELAGACGDFTPLQELSRERGDVLGFAMSLLRASAN